MPHETTKEIASLPPAIISTAASLFGIGLLVAWSENLSKRQVLLIIMCGLCAAILIPPFAVPMMLHKWPAEWWPGNEYLYSAAGFLSGLVGVKIVAAIIVFSDGMKGAASRAAGSIGGDK